jgi:hypothetical protein
MKAAIMLGVLAVASLLVACTPTDDFRDARDGGNVTNDTINTTDTTGATGNIEGQIGRDDGRPGADEYGTW